MGEGGHGSVGARVSRSRTNAPARWLRVWALAWIVALLTAACGSPAVDGNAPRGGEHATGASASDQTSGAGGEAASEPASESGAQDGDSGPGQPDEAAETPSARALAAAADPSGDLEIHFIDVGQGDATLLVAPDATVLVDAGRHDRSDVVAYLRSQAVSAIDVVVVTHPHADHLGQFDEVVDAFDVDEVWWSGATHTTQTFERALEALERSGAAYQEPRAGDSTAVGSLLFEFVNPPSSVALGDLHDSGLAFRVTYGGVRLLFTGDAEAATEARMVATAGSQLPADIYQVGHHGSGTSTSVALLPAVSPSVAVYSAGAGNSYGHPAPAVVDRLGAAGTELYGTDRHGTVVITTDGRTWRVATARHGTADTAPEPGSSRAPAPGPASAPAPPPPATDPEPATELSVTFTSVTSPVKAGSKATAAVATVPGASCSVTVTYKSGPSKAQGLDPKSASSAGEASWTWTVGSRTTTGDWPIDVTCELGGTSASARTLFTVQ